MLIAVLGTTPSHKRVITKDLLYLDELMSQYGSPNGDFINGIALLLNRNEELPVYLRPDVHSRLGELSTRAHKLNAAVIIPDIVQKSLFKSENVYKGIAEVYIRSKDREGIPGAVDVRNAVLSLGFWDSEKLLLLEMLLSARQHNLKSVSAALREGKVFWIEMKEDEAAPDERYRIIKFDSPSVIRREHENYWDVQGLLNGYYERHSTELQRWKKNTYALEEPHGQKYDLLNVIASTVESAGPDATWSSQTLEGRWNHVEDDTLTKILDNTFATLKILYQAGLPNEPVFIPEVSIREIYERFYKEHITPADSIVRCELDHGIRSVKKGEEDPIQPTDYPPEVGREFVDSGYHIEQISLRISKDVTDPEISLLVKKTEGERQKRVEVRLDPLSDFKRRRDFYNKGIKEDSGPFIISGVCESNYKSSLSNSILRCGPISGTKIISSDIGDIWKEQEITFASGGVHANPLYFYGQIYDGIREGTPISSIHLKSISTWIHGDLNAGNIIVRGNGDVRIIDLARLRKDGPLEFDFAELETDLKIRVLYKNCKQSLHRENFRVGDLIDQIFAFEKTLLRYFAEDFNPKEDNTSGGFLDEFRHGFRKIAQIRENLITMYGDLSQGRLSREDVLKAYMAAIFFESIAVLNFNLPPLAKTWALIASTVSCEKLIQLNAKGVGNFGA